MGTDVLTKIRSHFVIAVGMLMWAGAALGYPVGSPVSLEKMADQADVIFKGTVVAGEAVEDEGFPPQDGFVSWQTTFRIVSVLKGEKPGETLRFRHYHRDSSLSWRFQPQYYDLETGTTYIVLAKTGATPGLFQQVWMNHTLKEDQGVVRCADAKPVAAATVKEAVWAELSAMLESQDKDDVVYGIRQLDQMSGGDLSYDSTSDFDRAEVLAAVKPLIMSDEPEIAQAVLFAVGSHNPYMTEERALHWLATVGSGEVPGIGKMNPERKNPGGETYWKDLVAVADSEAEAETRALAIRALGLVGKPPSAPPGALQEAVERWLADPIPAVRASAALLLADLPEETAEKYLKTLAKDGAPEVRTDVARAAGFGAWPALAPLLAKLVKDENDQVRGAAAMSLLSFSPEEDSVARIFKANLDNEEFHPLFLIALARLHPEDHLDALAEAVEQKDEPRNFWGGRLPAFSAWEVLFKYLQAQPHETIRSGALDRYLDAMEKVGNFSSSEPRDIYAFYLQRGMTDRAKRFREAAKRSLSFNVDYFFDMVDEDPSQYTRE